MKKFFSILSAILALAACNKEKEIPIVIPEDDQTIVVDITIDRADAFGDEAGTKATVKKTWDDGDVVYLFFAGIPAPKYIEMKYNKGDWTATPKNGLTASDLSGDPTKKMTAVFLPYAYDATVTADENAYFVFDDLIYNGVFYFDFCNYTYDGTLQGHLRLEAPFGSSNEKLVHFDVSGLQEGHTYFLYQDNLKPIIYSYVSSTGGVSCNSNTLGMPLVGHIDGKRGIVSFSGLLTEEAAGKQVDYQFSIVDETASVIYTRDAGNHTISKRSAIGLGNLGDASKWIATEFVYMGIDNEKGERICWAKKNLGAENLWDCYADYYAWGETEPKSSDSDWSNYFDTTDGGSTFIKYNTAGGKTVLDLEDDVANKKWGGPWRIPTDAEWMALFDKTYFTLEWTADYLGDGSNYAGMFVTRKAGTGPCSGNSIYLPAAGYYWEGWTYINWGIAGNYWSSSLKTDNSKNAWSVFFYSYQNSCETELVDLSRSYGMYVRPIFTLADPTAHSDNSANTVSGSDYPGGGDPFGF